jgi:hypothetical protein
MVTVYDKDDDDFDEFLIDEPMQSGIRFTQYLLPDGRAKDIYIDRPADVEAKAAYLET